MASERLLRAGVLTLGSLFWEDKENSIPRHRAKGKERSEWREQNLNLVEVVPISAPIRYGRFSVSKNNTYTIVLSRSYNSKGKLGKVIAVPFKKEIDLTEYNNFEYQAIALGKAEGIYKITGSSLTQKKLVLDWGCVAIWINHNSEYLGVVKKHWQILIDSQKSFGYNSPIESFQWQDGSLLGEDYFLDLSIDCNFDFLFCSYILPKHKDEQLNKDMHYPTPIDVASSMVTSNYYTYFQFNRKSGIVTSDDEEIQSMIDKNLKKP